MPRPKRARRWRQPRRVLHWTSSTAGLLGQPGRQGLVFRVWDSGICSRASREEAMKRTAFLYVAGVTVTGIVAWITPSSLAQDNTGMATGNATANTKTQTGSKEAKQII